jgi:selenocysteine lyase/cysteine desulfurase
MTRRLYAKLIHAESPHCIAISSSTAHAISLASNNLIRSGVLSQNQAIVIMEGEMESSVYAWQNACKLTGCKLIVIPRPKNSTWSDEIIKYLSTCESNGSLAVVSLSCVHWCSGELIDIKGTFDTALNFLREIYLILLNPLSPCICMYLCRD